MDPQKKQNILLSLVFLILVFLLVGGVLLFSQQKKISSLENLLSSSKTAALNTQMGVTKKLSDAQASQADAFQKKMQDSAKFISGKITGISNGELAVEADMPDWQKMKEIASSPELSQQYKDKMAPTIKKNYNVSTTGETKFSGDQLSDIKAGDTVMISAKELVYQTDKLTAVSVASPYEKLVMPGQ